MCYWGVAAHEQRTIWKTGVTPAGNVGSNGTSLLELPVSNKPGRVGIGDVHGCAYLVDTKRTIVQAYFIDCTAEGSAASRIAAYVDVGIRYDIRMSNNKTFGNTIDGKQGSVVVYG